MTCKTSLSIATCLRVILEPELIEHASNCEGTWVFVDNRMVSTVDLAEIDLMDAQKIRLMPGLVGGN